MVMPRLHLPNLVVVRVYAHEIDAENSCPSWCFGRSPSWTLGYSIHEETVDATRFTPQAAHYD